MITYACHPSDLPSFDLVDLTIGKVTLSQAAFNSVISRST